MSLLSLSAPLFSTDDEELERNSLSQAECKQISRDIFGAKWTKGDDAEQARRIADAIVVMDSKVLQIPPEKKRAYMEALSVCPDIVDQESGSYAMLAAEDWDPSCAAWRLVRYWSIRKSLFGWSAFLPMTIEGALQNDTSILDTDFCMLLPNDKKGRSVVFYNRPAIDEICYDKDAVLRALWYVIHQAAKGEERQRAGFVLLVDARTYTIHQFNRKLAKLVVDSWANVIPLRLRALHVCSSPHRSILEIVCPAVKSILGKQYRCRMIVHSGEVKEILCELEEDYGIISKTLPVSLGGGLVSSETGLCQSNPATVGGILMDESARAA